MLNQPALHGPFQPKFWTALATVFVEIFKKKKIGYFLDQFQSPIKRKFGYLEKNGVLKFFRKPVCPSKFTKSTTKDSCFLTKRTLLTNTVLVLLNNGHLIFILKHSSNGAGTVHKKLVNYESSYRHNFFYWSQYITK